MYIITSIQHLDCVWNILSAFYTKSKYKNGKKSIDAFEEYADDVTSGSPILLKIYEVLRKQKNSNSGWLHHKKLGRLGPI